MLKTRPGITMAVVVAASWSTVSLANGLGENRPWQFRTANERNAQVNELTLRLLQEDGFGDGNGGSNGGGDTIINGDQYNCSVSSVTTGNDAANTIDGVTGTLMGVTGSSIGASSLANSSETDVDVDGSGTGTADTSQTNDGSITSGVDGSHNSSTVGSFQGGGATDQDLSSHQSIADSTLTSSAQGTVSCDRVYN